MRETPPSALARWVHEEFRNLCPDILAALFLGAHKPSTLVFSPSVSQTRLSNGNYIAPADILSAAVWPAGKAPENMISVDAFLPQSAFVTRKIEVPAKAIGQIYAIAALDLARRTPFKPNEAVWTLSSPIAEAGKVSTTQWVIHKDDCERLQRRLRDEGFLLTAVRIEHLPPEIPAVHDFSYQYAQSRQRWRRVNLGLVLASLFAIFIGLAYPTVQQSQELTAAKSEVEANRAQALSLRQEIETLRAASSDRVLFLEKILHRRHLAETLRSLTVALPDHVWASQIAFSQEGVVITGTVSGSAADLVIGLTDIKEFENPRLSGAVTSTSNGDEGFELAMAHRVAR